MQWVIIENCPSGYGKIMDLVEADNVIEIYNQGQWEPQRHSYVPLGALNKLTVMAFSCERAELKEPGIQEVP